MVMEAQTIQQVFGQIATICGFFAGDWTGLYMRCMLLYASLQRRVLANVSGEDTTTNITDDMISRLISE